MIITDHYIPLVILRGLFLAAIMERALQLAQRRIAYSLKHLVKNLLSEERPFEQ